MLLMEMVLLIVVTKLLYKHGECWNRARNSFFTSIYMYVCKHENILLILSAITIPLTCISCLPP